MARKSNPNGPAPSAPVTKRSTERASEEVARAVRGADRVARAVRGSKHTARAVRGPKQAARAVRGRGLLPSLVGYHLRLTQVAVFRDFADALQGLDASPGRFGLLVLIRANPGLSQSRLAEAIELDRSSLVPALNKLEREDLVERRGSTTDRRANGIWLTAKGAALVTRMQQRVKAHEARLLRGFSAEDKARLIELLGRVRENLAGPSAQSA